MKPLNIVEGSKDDYVSQRARGDYVSTTCRQDLMFAFSYAAQFTNPRETEFKMLNKTIKTALQTKDVGLNFIPIDFSTASISGFIDASFAGNSDFTSQLGFIVTLMDAHGNTNIIHYGSIESKKITRSVLAAELYAMMLGFDVSYVMSSTISDITGKHMLLHLYTD